jgi:hypothetical protein
MGINFAYPEILGIIGYTYIVCGFCYLLTRRWLWAPVAWFFVFLAYNIAAAAKLVNWVHPWWWWPVQNGAFQVMVFAGVVLTTIFFLEPKFNTFARKAWPAVAVGVVTALAAWLLSPLGISKIRATPTWALYTVAACYLIYVALYYICDVKGSVAWAAPVKAAGSNTLFTYLLPDFWYFGIAAVDFVWLANHLNTGLAGILRTVVFTAVMLWLASLLTKWRVRIQI